MAQRWIEIRVVHGPVLIGETILRAVEAKDDAGGVLKVVEAWSNARWRPASGFGWRNVLKAQAAPLDLLELMKVPSERFPKDYSPLQRYE